jgi:hypothetical protein
MRRDHAILSGLMSHMSAAKLAQYWPITVQPSSTCLEQFDENFDAPARVVIVPELEESVAELQRQVQTAPGKIPNTFSQIKAKAIEEFEQRLRDPQFFLLALPIKTGFSAESKGGCLDQSRPAQNPLIVPFIGQSSKSRNVASLLSATEMFDLPHFKDTLTKFPTTTDVLASLQRFFLDCSGVPLDVSNVLSLAHSSELYPDVDQHKRRGMMRNIATFIAEFAGFGENPGMVTRVNAPQIITDAITAVLTVHNALRSTSLVQYCDECPLTRKISFTDPLVQTTMIRIWQAMKTRFPKLELVGLGGIQQLNSVTRYRNNSSFPFPTGMRSDETMTTSDPWLVVFLLPMILQFDAVVDFAIDEIISRGHPSATA